MNTYFIGTALATASLYMVSATGNSQMLRAPQRTAAEGDSRISLSLNAGGVNEDLMVVTCDDEAVDTYTRGKDVQKMGTIVGAQTARLWTNAKGTELCAVNVAYANDKAIVPLQIYAPKNGEYTLSLNQETEVDVYLTRDGVIIWDLGMSEYAFDMKAGTDDSYALLVVRRISHVATGVDQTDNDSKRGTNFVEKIIVNGQLFILRDGILYDAQGKKVTNL